MSAGRIASIVAGTVAALLAIGFLAAGGVLLWGDSEKDSQGYLSTGSDRFATTTHALATDRLDVDLDGAGWIMDRDDYGNVRLDVTPRGDEPVFVGIAPTEDVSAYLSGTSYASVSDVSYSPFRADYRDHAGAGLPTPPADERFWAASAQGSGPQTLKWDVEDGEWSIVVMNADGSPGVDAGISAGAKVPILSTAGWISIGVGIVLLITAGGLVFLGVRAPRATAVA